jgi:hypothetical protein
MSGFDGTLDLTGARDDQVGFPAVPSGAYEGHIGKAEWKSTDNVDGTKKLPHDTPYLAIGFRINTDHEPVDGQEVAGVYGGWTNLYVPPADYDKGKAQQMKNRMANFLTAIGEDWQKKGFKMPDPSDLIGKPLVAVIRKKADRNQSSGYSNEIEGFKPEGTAAESTGATSGSGLR